MKIDFACESCGKSYSVDASLAGRTGRCKACGDTMRIPRPAPAPSAAAGGVDDPYGLDESSSVATIRPDMLADDGGAPLPRRGASKGGAGPKKKKRRRTADDGPWNLPLRTLAVNATGLALIGSFVLTVLNHSPGFQRAALIFSMIQFGVALLAASLTTASVVGAGVSFAKGNRRAFSGERFVGQLVWCYAVFQAVLVGVVISLVATPGGRARMAIGLGRSLPTLERADLFVYQDLVGSALGVADELAEMFERFPDVDRDRLTEMLQGHAASRARAETTPLPTGDQVKFLRAQFDVRARMTMERLAAAGRTMLERLKAGGLGPDVPQSALETATRDFEKMIREASGAKATLDRLGPEDDLAWYRTILSPSAGTRVAAPAPAGRPGEMPPDARRMLEESQRRMDEMRRSFGPPPSGFPGPSPSGPFRRPLDLPEPSPFGPPSFPR